ncbi:Maltose operon substrate-binding protein precursor (MalM) [Thiothrix caldifontis]|jgi:Maltose operon periplasmic protein precursor (MalM).|uniref:Maltose operon substrate-binding protein (MalM) n=1 Tax=Thiothrix caldifontis TaxID=525918 RepID=A0A1H4ASZ2_9GAMM|nr:MalM family protein [Thiothrix caldifontis]SEA38802.1 Maltose operon substrate-binding protein precursor (MalM) [Thiothrix caldifontis]
MKIIEVFAAVALLSGCANVDYKANLQQASVCCNQLADIQYLPLSYDKPLEAAVGSKETPVRLFDGSKSFFLAAQLPAFTAPYEVQITSEPVGTQLFAPQGLLLNANHQVVRKIPASAFQYSNGWLSHKFFLNRDEGLRYVVLYAAQEEVGKAREQRHAAVTTSPIVAGAYTFHYSVGNDVQNKITSAEGGKLTLKAVTYQLRDAK